MELSAQSFCNAEWSEYWVVWDRFLVVNGLPKCPSNRWRKLAPTKWKSSEVLGIPYGIYSVHPRNLVPTKPQQVSADRRDTACGSGLAFFQQCIIDFTSFAWPCLRLSSAWLLVNNSQLPPSPNTYPCLAKTAKVSALSAGCLWPKPVNAVSNKVCSHAVFLPSWPLAQGFRLASLPFITP